MKQLKPGGILFAAPWELTHRMDKNVSEWPSKCARKMSSTVAQIARIFRS